MTAGASDGPVTAHRQVARLTVLFPPPWVISHRIMGRLVTYLPPGRA